MFDAIRFVGTPIALLAFVAAVLGVAYARRLAQRRKLIEQAPDSDRLEAIESVLRDFKTVPTDRLTSDDQYDLVLKILEERRAKVRIGAVTAVIIATVLSILIGYTWVNRPTSRTTAPDSASVTLSEGLDLKSALEYLAELKGGSPIFHDSCTPEHLATPIRPGYMNAASVTELMRALQGRLTNPPPDLRLKVNRVRERGIYEIQCND
jgi:hypothetical protein